MQYSLDSMSRNTFFREDLGAIILHSSNNAFREMLTKRFLIVHPGIKLAATSNIFKTMISSIISSKINAGNVVYALLSEKDYLLSEIEKSRKLLDEQFFTLEPDAFIENFRVLLCGKALFDASYFPAQLDFGLGYYGNAYSPSVGDIIRAVGDERYNFLIPFFRNEILPLLEQEQPHLVGISLTGMFELIPAFTLAHMIKEFNPSTHITLGGVLVTELSHRISNNSRLWSFFDSLVLGPGEEIFNELIDRIDTGTELSSVPNIIYKDDESIKTSTKSKEFDLNDACTPEFVSLRRSSGLPLETSSSCYWGKCIFCYYPRQGSSVLDPAQHKKRMRRIDLVLEDIKNLKEKYNPSLIGLTDSCVHPKRLKDIAEANITSGNKVKFFALFRMEKEFKSKEFCTKLAEGGFMGGYVGLESGSQRVNNIINKGINIVDLTPIIKNFKSTRILAHIYSIIGSPGETRQDAAETYKFFKRWHKYLKLGWQIYPLYVLEKSPIGQNASSFGLTVTPLPEDYLTEFMLYKVSSGLSQEESMGLAINYTEQLKSYMHPLSSIMDIESMKMFLLTQMAKGISPEQITMNLHKI